MINGNFFSEIVSKNIRRYNAWITPITYSIHPFDIHRIRAKDGRISFTSSAEAFFFENESYSFKGCLTHTAVIDQTQTIELTYFIFDQIVFI